MNRAQLESQAKQCCPADLFYDLLNTIDETPSAELEAFIVDNTPPAGAVAPCQAEAVRLLSSNVDVIEKAAVLVENRPYSRHCAMADGSFIESGFDWRYAYDALGFCLATYNYASREVVHYAN